MPRCVLFFFGKARRLNSSSSESKPCRYKQRPRSKGAQKMDWFLKRVPYIWLFLTTVIIAAVLHSIYKSGGFN